MDGIFLRVSRLVEAGLASAQSTGLAPVVVKNSFFEGPESHAARLA